MIGAFFTQLKIGGSACSSIRSILSAALFDSCGAVGVVSHAWQQLIMACRGAWY